MVSCSSNSTLMNFSALHHIKSRSMDVVFKEVTISRTGKDHYQSEPVHKQGGELYRSARGAGCGYWHLEGSMEWPWNRQTESYTPLSSKGRQTGSMRTDNKAICRSPCTVSFVAGARRSWVRRSPCTGSFTAGAQRSSVRRCLL